MAVAEVEGRRIRIQGTVQGVGFRPWVYRIAQSAGVSGRVCNDSAGVTIDAFGDEASLSRFIDALHFPPPAARILAFDAVDIEAEPARGFEIVHSAGAAEPRASIPPDLSTCDDCLAEIFDPGNRRYRYPFTTCTHCGPRFTIATDIPYDRATTTMAGFEMCPECRREYADAADRRFHAQPNACPKCGPSLTLHASDGTRLYPAEPIAAAAEALTAGAIVAVKGIGGFHLACDATNDRAVRELRARKHRDEKPLAVMVRDMAAAEGLAVVDDAARALLASPERPIVLLERRTGGDADLLSPSIAPANRMLGVFLPYSPLHHLLLHDVGRPLVMTSGNLSDEPIAQTNDEAVARLGHIADLFLLHDRPIAARADDSVTVIIDGRPGVVRRSRGHVPHPIEVTRGFTRPVLACGALLKNTFCLASGHSAWLGPHIGDLENVETFDAFTEAIARMERFLQIAPEVIAHDLHPDYLSSLYASQRPEALKVAVQHHHAHVVSAMVEHGIDGPAIGIAYDGTGYGTDGTMWGGEVLLASADAFHRLATFRALPLPGGDRAIREPWRLALALVVDAFDDRVPPDVWPLFGGVPLADLEAVRTLVNRAPLPLARGVGRYFDAFGALFLARTRASFEGQTALEWNQAADPAVARAYPFAIADGPQCPEIDLRQMVRAAAAEFVNGVPASDIAAAFHNTIAGATASVVRRAVERFGALPIVASGGCFQNARLAQGIVDALAPEHRVLLHERVPPNDGGIALGQAVIADALARGH